MEIQAAPIEDTIPEIELRYNPPPDAFTRIQITTPMDAYNLFMKTWDTTKIELVEQFKVLLLNRANRPLGVCTLSTGGTGRTIIDIKLLFAVALKTNASAIIVAHNHPSGELKPSKSDIDTTKQIYQAGKLLDIPLHDHLIVSRHSFYSLQNEGTF